MMNRLLFTFLLPVVVVLGCETGCVYEQITPTYAHYNGTVSKSVTGKTCCPWTSSNPATLIVAGTNYCRNNNNDLHMYCNVGDCNAPVAEYCDTGSFACPLCTNPPIVPTTTTLTYPCIAPQALASTANYYNRIVGGQDAIPHEFPFYVSIQRNGGVYCSGSLIHKDWIMTAQHCTYEADNSATPMNVYTIKIGLHKYNDADACVETRSVISIIKTPGYGASGRNDLAFFKLSSSSNYPPITLYRAGLITENLEAENLMMTIIGHGTLVSGGVAAVTLQKGVLPLYNQSACVAYWSPDVDNTEICAGYHYGTVDTCQGDSGGPMFVKRGTTFIQIGTTAFGYGCATADSPGVYMRLSSFATWICANLPAEICQTTVAPTTAVPTTPAPTTRSPTTRSPTTASPTLAPTTASPITESPTTKAPTTAAPTTETPTTGAPTTGVPTTSGPTMLPTTSSPTTARPTNTPTTASPTESPTTAKPTTRVPTESPTTAKPTTRMPTQSPTTPTAQQLAGVAETMNLARQMMIIIALVVALA